ncbi:MAG: hypothetical protein ACRDHS_14415 [Actinomycetota bacterium]
MPKPPDRVPFVQLAPPVTSVAWSSAFVAQSIEALFVYLGPNGAHHLRPLHAETLRVGWSPEAKPGQIVLDAAARYELTPMLVHSTSWRHEEARVVLTYVAAVAPPEKQNIYLADEPVVRADLARGDAFGPPPEIGVAQVIEHAFRHLSWLVKDDAVVGKTLADWVTFLDEYEPEPFRAFGPVATPD